MANGIKLSKKIMGDRVVVNVSATHISNGHFAVPIELLDSAQRAIAASRNTEILAALGEKHTFVNFDMSDEAMAQVIEKPDSTITYRKTRIAITGCGNGRSTGILFLGPDGQQAFVDSRYVDCFDLEVLDSQLPDTGIRRDAGCCSSSMHSPNGIVVMPMCETISPSDVGFGIHTDTDTIDPSEFEPRVTWETLAAEDPSLSRRAA